MKQLSWRARKAILGRLPLVHHLVANPALPGTKATGYRLSGRRGAVQAIIFRFRGRSRALPRPKEIFDA